MENINTLSKLNQVLLKNNFILFKGKKTPTAFIDHMQFQTIRKHLNLGNFKEVVL